MAAAAATVGADEAKRLQAQIDQMRERLDFMAPMLPLVNIVQEYFQKVECEASMQIMRLNNAQIYSRPQSDEDSESNAQLETAKWLHFITDLIMQHHNGSSVAHRVPSADDPAQPLKTLAAAWRGAPLGAEAPSAFDRPSRKLSANHPATPPILSPRKPPAVLDLPPGRPPAVSPDGRGGPQLARDGRAPESSAAIGHSELAGSFSERARSLLPDLALSAAASAGAAARGPGVFSIDDGEPPKDTRFRGANDQDIFLVEPGVGGMPGNALVPESPSMSGLVLGRGSWATAYRQASGQRRDALRLLCMSGIVTARELSDDLTVISQEHIDECVFISSEMLQTMPLELWSKQPEEANKFFEARLTSLYQRKFGQIAAADAARGR